MDEDYVLFSRDAHTGAIREYLGTLSAHDVRQMATILESVGLDRLSEFFRSVVGDDEEVEH